MQQNAKVSHGALRAYFEVDFARGADFGPAWQGDQLVETATVNGQLLHADENGYPTLRDAFVKFMDENDSDACASYGDMVAIYDGMKRPPGGSDDDDRMNHLHGAISWLAFDRIRGVTQEQYAERRGVTERTVRYWLKQAIAHVARQLTGGQEPGQVIIFPASYEPATSPAAASG